jgi:gamma-aminobutyric acid type B receptor
VLLQVDIFLTSVQVSAEETNRNASVLHLLVLVPLPASNPDSKFAPAFDKGHSIIPAVQLAVEQINKRKDLLPGHTLQITVGDSGCDKISRTAAALVENLFYGNTTEGIEALRDKQIAGIVGPSCSEASIFLVESLQRTGILQLYSGNTPVLSTSNPLYKYSFGMISSSKVYIETLLRIAEESNWDWKNVAILYESSRSYQRETFREFLKRIDGARMGYISPIVAPFFVPLAEIKQLNIRIVIALTGGQAARQLACLAGHLDFTYPIHQIIYTDRVVDNFLDKTDFNFTLSGDAAMYLCNKQYILRGLKGSVFMRYSLDTLNENLTTESGYSIKEIRDDYQEMLMEYQKSLPVNMTLKRNVYAYPYYDATWALVLSINKTMNLMRNTSLNFGYKVSESSEMLRLVMANISFQGVSVDVNFSKERHVTNDVDLFQADGNRQIKRGYWNGTRNAIVTSNVSVSLFIDDEFLIEYTKIHPSLIGVGVTAIIITLVFVIVLQITNILMHKDPAIKSNSPRLNHFIFLGCYLYIVSVLFITISMGFPNILIDVTLLGPTVCNIIPFSTILGQSLIIGTIIVKLWRIYSIFKRTFHFQRFLDDKYLATFVILNAAFTIILYVPILIWSPFNVDIIETNIIQDNKSVLPIKVRTLSCYTLHIPWLILPPVVHQVLALMLSVMIATLNRKVKHKYFRNTAYINMLVYILAVTVGIGGSVLFILQVLSVNVNAFYVVFIVLLLFNVYACLLLLVVRFLFM